MDATNAVDKILEYIIDTTNEFDAKERVMVLCTISEHCKAYAETVMAHEYHRILYRQKQVDE